MNSRLLIALIAAASAAACSKTATDSGSTAAALALVQGGNQLVQGGKELPNPIVVRVLGANGLPAVGVPVGFIVASGGGSVNPGSALSDGNGEVKTKWTLGPTQPEQVLRATVAVLEPLNVTATAIVPTDLILAQGNNQVARVSSVLPSSIVVRVVGLANTPMSGIPVQFQVTAGGGIISPQSAMTNALGEVTVKWTLGSQPGSNSVVATSLSLSPIVVSATATP